MLQETLQFIGGVASGLLLVYLFIVAVNFIKSVFALRRDQGFLREEYASLEKYTRGRLDAIKELVEEIRSDVVELGELRDKADLEHMDRLSALLRRVDGMCQHLNRHDAAVEQITSRLSKVDEWTNCLRNRTANLDQRLRKGKGKS